MSIVGDVIRALGFEYDDEPSNSDAISSQETRWIGPKNEDALHQDDRATLAAEEKVYVTLDGDDVGGEVEESLMQDTTEVAEELSAAIHRAHDQIQQLIKQLDGRLAFEGGDNLMAVLPPDKVDEFTSKVRELYKKETNHSVTIGVGKSPMQAHYALVYGKNTGKNKIVTYDAKVAEEVKKIKEKQKALETTYKQLKYKAEKKEAFGHDMAYTWVEAKKKLFAGGSWTSIEREFRKLYPELTDEQLEDIHDSLDRKSVV